MINRIDYIKDFGIFKRFNWDSSIVDFKKKNILYGWNYSGKTTLSRVFSSLRDKKIFEDYPIGDFKITTSNNKSYSKNNIIDFPYKVLVFNSDYVKDNLKWGIDENINAIFFQVGEDAKNATKIEELEKKILEINGDENIKGEKEPFLAEINDFEAFEGSLFTNESRRIKNEIFSSLIDFNKGHFKKQIPFVIQNLNGFILNKTEVSKLSKIVKIEEPKPIINEIQYDLNINQIIKEVNKILIKEPNKSNVLKILEQNNETLEWVRKGLELNKPKTKCLFCGNEITDERIKLLNRFYENESSKLRESSKLLFEKLKNEEEAIHNINFPKSIQDINEGFQEQYSKKKTLVDRKLNSYLKKIQNINKQLSQKINKHIYDKVKEIIEYDIESLIKELEELNDIIKKNNEFTRNFQDLIKAERLKYINHLVAKFLKENKYISKEKKYKKAKYEIEKLDNNLKIYHQEIERIKALKNSGEEGCQQFNYFIQSFLGKEDIKIEYNKKEKYFRLLRGNNVAKNLSEGEKMAISFSHFLVTLKSIEDKSELNNYILFIDDPMSSLDGNHIFQINALLKDFLYEKIPNPSNPSQQMWNQKCLQLFISTHNYEFFNLLKEMPTTRGFSYEKKLQSRKETRYYISRKINNSSIEMLPKVYDDFKSEYHYLFKQINDFNNDPNNTKSEKLLLMPNILRRFLEIYSLAKYPSKDEVDDRTTKIFGPVASKRILKPFHYFSHFNNIDRIGKQSELLADVSIACKELIKQVKKDKKHYEALKSIL